MEKRNKRNECWECIHKREVPGNAHIRCDNPDQGMKGDPHGIKNGWFAYPILFDPVWKENECKNFKIMESNSKQSTLQSAE
jgi:hypothetical protein